MSDIYLQITETPAVVTLSAPVVSGALASTVTVANTVTVALDSNSLSALENVTVTVGAAITGTVTVSNFPATQTIAGTVTVGNSLTIQSGNISIEEAFGEASFMPISGTVTVGNTVTIAGTVTANPTGTQTIAGTVTANVGNIESIIGNNYQSLYNLLDDLAPNVTINGAPSTGGTQPISGTVTVGNSVTISSLPSLVAGTAQIGVVTIGNIRRAGDNALSQLSTEAGSGYLLTRSTLNAGSEQIGSVTASISNSVTIASLPAISGTVTANVQDLTNCVEGFDEGIPQNVVAVHLKDLSGNVLGTSGTPLPISGTVTAVNHQGTAVTTSNFTSTTASTVLASANTSREVLTIFNEGAGNLHICAGATCTTIAYQVRLSAGDYYEVPLNQTSLTHSAVFATAGTARIVQIS